jgi:hypothetical protein
LVTTFAGGFIIIGYEHEAARHGWPVSDFLAENASLAKTLSLAGMLTPLGVAFARYSWWSPLLVLSLGIILAYVLSTVLQWREQIFALGCCTVGLALIIVYML